MRAILLASAALLATFPAGAQQALIAEPARPGHPVPIAGDLNVRRVDYVESVRYRIITTPNRVLVIRFAPNENILRIVFGDAAKAGDSSRQILTKADNAQQNGSGKGEELGNILHLWPQHEGFTTVLVVTVVDEGAKPDRVYLFAVRVQEVPDPCAPNQPEIGCCKIAKECDDPEATQDLRIDYPQEKKQEEDRRRRDQRGVQAEQQAVQRERQGHQTAVARLKTDHFSGGGQRNFCWQGQGDREIGPAKPPSDNAQHLTLDFGGRPIPALLRVNPDNTDGGPIIPVVRDSLVVLQEVPTRVRMRIGTTQVLDLIRCTPAPHVDPGTGTSSPDVARVVRRAQR